MEMMAWKDILIMLAQTLCYACTALVIPLIVRLLQSKVRDERMLKFLALAEKTIAESVTMINQTFVDVLKSADSWDSDAMRDAFLGCKQNVLKLLNDDAKAAIVMLHGDLDAWIDTMIEANVKQLKLT